MCCYEISLWFILCATYVCWFFVLLDKLGLERVIFVKSAYRVNIFYLLVYINGL